MRNRIFAIMIPVLAFCLFLPKSVEAEEAAPGAARISQIQGEVSVMRGDTGEWVATTVNAPLAPGDSISTGERSRTEVQLDYANVLPKPTWKLTRPIWQCTRWAKEAIAFR